MNRITLITLGLTCAVIAAAGIMRYHQIQSIKLPIMILSRTEGRGFPGLEQQKTAYLPNDYGFLINYLGQTEPEFYLYNRPAWTITVTGDFRQFIAGLKQFPDHAKVDWIRCCTVSFEYGMPYYEREWLDETIASKGFRMTDLEDGNETIDSCEFQNILLKDTGQPAKKTPEPAEENITPEQIIELADKLYNGDPDEVYVTVKILRELKSREAIKQAIGFLSHPESETRGAAADILGYWQAEKAIPPLIRLLSDPDAEVRNSSVYALRLLKAKEAIPEITGLLFDSDAQVRSTAVDALDELYAARENAPAIIKLLSDPDEEVRLSAIRALDKLEDAIPDIKRLLSDPEGKVREAAEEFLRDFGVPAEEIGETDKIDINTLRQQLREEPFRIVHNHLGARVFIGKNNCINAIDVIPEIITLLKDNDSVIRLWAINVLSIISARESIPEIEKLLNDKEIDVRQAAEKALKKLGVPDSEIQKAKESK
jgi:HEAT repeat protein